MTLAVLLPGRAYPVELPAIASVGDVVAAHAYDVLTVAWEGLDELPEDPVGWVVEHLEATLAGRVPDLVVAKSMSTLAASYVAERGWPAVWVTPLLREPEIVDGIRANPAAQLLVCGADDPFHDAGVAAGLTVDSAVEVLELPALDHALSSGDGVVVPKTVVAVERAVDAFLGGLA